jgi:hypothetical protein
MTWKRKVRRKYSPTGTDHLYTTTRTEGTQAEGYVEEGYLCKLLPNPRPPQTIGVYRLDREASENPKVTRDHMFVLLTDEQWEDEATRLQAIPQGYAVADLNQPLGHVYTSRRDVRTIRVFELEHKEDGRHFYTDDKDEAHTAADKDNYSTPRVLCHAVPPPFSWRTRLRFGAVFALFGLMAFISAKWGETLYFSRVVGSWGLIIGVTAVVGAYILRAELGKRPPD